MTFDPNRHVSRIAGKGGASDYLGARVALAWLRDRHPDAILETDLLRLEPGFALVRADVRIPGGGRATGHGSEHAGDFADFLEKAETKAIRRALVALGFSVEAARAGRRTPAVRAMPNPARPAVDPGAPATADQVRAIADLARKLGLAGERLGAFADRAIGSVDLAQLAHGQAATLIHALQAAQRQRQRAIESSTP